MRDHEIEQALDTRRHLDHGEEDQERDRGDDLRHHQRLVDHGVDRRQPAEGPRPRGAERRHGRQHRGEEGGLDRQDQRADGRVLHRLVLPGGDVPLERETLPDRDVLAGVEGIDHQRDDGRVEQKEADDRDRREARQGLQVEGPLAPGAARGAHGLDRLSGRLLGGDIGHQRASEVLETVRM